MDESLGTVLENLLLRAITANKTPGMKTAHFALRLDADIIFEADNNIKFNNINSTIIELIDRQSRVELN